MATEYDSGPGLSEKIDPAVGVSSHSDASDLEWTEEEEKSLVRKIDCIVMPILLLGFYALQLDRSNIGNALTDYFLKDIGITQDQFNVGQQLLSIGIVLLEIPSNLILYYLGPVYWIGGQIFTWGLVATFQAFQKNLASFLVTRLLLGICEAGFIPASLFTITRWYKRDETSKRFSIFFIGNMLSSATGGLIAYGILHMRGVAGLAGWKWLFIIEGVFTCCVGIIFVSTFPRDVRNPVSILGIRYFSERERQILVQRVLRDDPSKIHNRTSVTKEELKSALTNWKLVPHVLATISGLAPATTIGSYAPTLVNRYGFGRLKSNAMVSIGYWILLVVNVLWGQLADRFGNRGILVFIGFLLPWGFTIGDRILATSSDRDSRFGLLIATIGFSYLWHPVNVSWVSLNAKTAGERSISMAIMIMAANCSGIIGSQLFRSDDAPVYKRGWSVIVALTSVALVFAAIANVQYRMANRRKKRNPERGGRVYRY